MANNNLFALKMMVEAVTESQNCVLEVIIGDNGFLARLIPRDMFEEEDFEND